MKEIRYCSPCKHRIVMHNFSQSNCEICDSHIDTASSPPNTICEKCGDEFGLCNHCGKFLELDHDN